MLLEIKICWLPFKNLCGLLIYDVDSNVQNHFRHLCPKPWFKTFHNKVGDSTVVCRPTSGQMSVSIYPLVTLKLSNTNGFQVHQKTEKKEFNTVLDTAPCVKQQLVQTAILLPMHRLGIFLPLLPPQPNSVSILQDWLIHRNPCIVPIKGYNLTLQWDSDKKMHAKYRQNIFLFHSLSRRKNNLNETNSKQKTCVQFSFVCHSQ